MRQITDSEIIDLLSKGYKKEILAFEFDIPIEKVKECANQVNQNKIAKNQNIYSPQIEAIIKRYNLLNSNTNYTTINQPLIQTELTSTHNIEEKFLKINNVTNKKNILKQIKSELENSTLTLEQCNRFIDMISNINKNFYSNEEFRECDYLCKKIKVILEIKLSDAIRIQLYNAKSIEELKKLLEKCNILKSNKYESSILLKGIQYQIERKIEKLQQENAIERARNINCPEILKIVAQISEGILNVDEINRVIDEEIKRKLENKPRNKFGNFTPEQEKEKIFIQINRTLIQQAEQYPIKDAENTIEILRKLSGKLENSVRTVVMNFVARREFEIAKKICEKCLKTNENIETPYVRLIKNDIRNAEICNKVQEILHRECTTEKANETLKLIELKINSGEIKGSSIILGKSNDGKNITLEDICANKLNTKKR